MYSGVKALFNRSKKLKGRVVLKPKNVLDTNSITSVKGAVQTTMSVVGSTFIDSFSAFSGKCVSLRLISATKAAENGSGKVGKKTYLEGVISTIPTLTAEECGFHVHFDWDIEDMGIPGAFTIRNHLLVEFFLVSLTLEDVPNLKGPLDFVCNSWLYNHHLYDKDRIFFSNELNFVCVRQSLRNFWLLVGVIYGVIRFVADCKSEKRSSKIYVPRDEHFGHLKSSDFLCFGIKSISRNVWPHLKPQLDSNISKNEFESFDEVHHLSEGGIKLPLDTLSKISSLPLLQEIFRTDGENVLKFSVPHVNRVNKSAWMTDDEFAREMLAGVNPCSIRRLQAIKCDRLFILDHHDVFMPFLRRINEYTSSKAYATRTILFLKDDGTLKPLAIELSLPHPSQQQGAYSKVVLPANDGVESTIWLLAKAHVVVNDSCYHQLISHWLNTHAVMEPFVIATNRNLSVLHPVHKLLFPHYRDTMNINALARELLINADGTIENCFLGGKYAMEMSSAVYKHWIFPEQALPADLIKRGMAIEDSSSPNGLRLVIKDYPYAVDGLEIWNAIKTWVKEYVSLYYVTDDMVKKDRELQAWWREVVEKGHGDLKEKSWWPKVHTREELIQSCTIIIWVASALHAAVNFGQYPYGGFILNRPTLSRRLIPEKGTAEYDEMEKNPEKAYLRTITPKYQTLVDLSVIEILSRHASDEVYLGQRGNPYWTSNPKAREAFKRFGEKLAEIEKKISERNHDPNLKNRTGPVKLPYTLLLPKSDAGLTFRGIPNSISI
ncbi:Seed linoleate 9S-lipoxygenase-3 [Vigna angularis]|uniref:Seed linoleate 9S-lipoxygenase-3 n=1 Tax=Phaseolus angularis TaxID=3914 RepID=A0A8T0JRV1_PHAAN|nr:Seed linoleate 9S-lipoxygenase-3 [Vigna angularis]